MAEPVSFSVKQIPNLLTGMRLLLIPVLWVFALLGHAVVIGIGMAFAWLTDALDGFLARRLNAQTPWGSRFDSIADGLVFASGLVWLVLLRPEFVREHALLLGTWVAIGAVAYTVGWIRFRRVADVHLYSAKAANFLGFMFLVYFFTVGTYPPVVFYIVIGVCILAATETLLVLATSGTVDEHRTTFLGRRNRRSRERPPRKAHPF